MQIAAVDNKLSATVRDVNTRIDNILLADRKTTPQPPRLVGSFVGTGSNSTSGNRAI